ncbi:50S ribosomal protein L41e [Nanobdella aerobiophila]|uniref:50S ribosomal protein L41e n=1 Tax=Nanobdella aerobiophila TaxID=2586965 RepID=A0A915SG42_9ARCH|nr:50S ribosomal protein L41e [Nanobdella aerobiophila]
MKRSSRRWKKYLRSRWKWQRRRIREEKRLRKVTRLRAL